MKKVNKNLLTSEGTVIAPQIFSAYITYFIDQIFDIRLFIFQNIFVQYFIS
jgi:hypothetical protein